MTEESTTLGPPSCLHETRGTNSMPCSPQVILELHGHLFAHEGLEKRVEQLQQKQARSRQRKRCAGNQFDRVSRSDTLLEPPRGRTTAGQGRSWYVCWCWCWCSCHQPWLCGESLNA